MKFHLLLVFKYPCQAKCSSRKNCVSAFVRTRLDRLMDEWQRNKINGIKQMLFRSNFERTETDFFQSVLKRI